MLPLLIAIFCTGIFAGSAIFISIVQHPAMIQAGSTREGLLEMRLKAKEGIVISSIFHSGILTVSHLPIDVQKATVH